MDWVGERIKLNTENTGICFSSISTPLCFPDYSSPPLLPSCLESAFRSCRVDTPDKTDITKVLFATHQFDNANTLAESLVKFCTALEQVSNPLLPPLDSTPDPTPPPPYYLSLNWLEMVVTLSQRHMREFYSLGVLSDGDLTGEAQAGGGLHVASLVYSERSGSTRTSAKETARSTEAEKEEDLAQQKSLHKQSLEEFSLVLALKNSILCSLSPDSQKHAVIVRLITDLFPGCDVEGLLAHEAGVREGLAVKARENREAVESARESRAASVMQMMREDSLSNEGEGMNTIHCTLCS